MRSYPPPITQEVNTIDVNLGKEDDGEREMLDKKRMSCKHDKKGVCDLHGEGASRHWKPAGVTHVWEGGRRISKVIRAYSYRCDLDLEGKKKLRQSKLSFGKTTLKITQPQKPKDNENDGNDTTKGHLGLSTSTEG